MCCSAHDRYFCDDACAALARTAHAQGAVDGSWSTASVELAVASLNNLDAASLASHGADVVQLLKASDAAVREAAVRAIARVDPRELGVDHACVPPSLKLGGWVRKRGACSFAQKRYSGASLDSLGREDEDR